MEKVTIVLQGQTYEGKLDMRALANVQAELKKQNIVMTIQEIFESISKQDLNVVLEICVQAIQRCHKTVKRHNIEDKIGFGDMEVVFNFIAKLAEVSMPKADEGK